MSDVWEIILTLCRRIREETCATKETHKKPVIQRAYISRRLGLKVEASNAATTGQQPLDVGMLTRMPLAKH